MFKPVIIPNKRIDVRLPHSHDCPTTAFRSLCCIDENGNDNRFSMLLVYVLKYFFLSFGSGRYGALYLLCILSL